VNRMKIKAAAVVWSILSLWLLLTALAIAGEGGQIPLPEPQKTGGKPLLEVLRERKSSREFSSQELSLQELSNLLWAAFGINRPELGKRTAPSAKNKQEIDIYVATANGLFLYDPQGHSLHPILKDDIRAATGLQPFVKDAPVNLIFVADFSRMEGYAEEQKPFYSACDTGFISQNVYLYCASQGLATVVRASIDRASLSQLMGLRPEQKISLAQTVGYPKR